MPARRHAPTGDPQLKTAARRRCLATVYARRAPCYRCGKPINYQLRWPNPAAPVGDEIIPRRLGGDPTDPANVVASHNRCNAQDGAAHTNRVRRRRQPTAPDLIDNDW